MSRRPEILSLALLIIACKRDVPAPPPEASSDADARAAPIATGPPFDGSYLELAYDASDPGSLSAVAEEVQLRMLGGPPPVPKRAKSIGHTSVVFKIELEDGKKLVFKPQSKKGFDRWKGEIAAYDLAQLLSIDAVPPAWSRPFVRAELARAAASDEKATSLMNEEVVATGDLVLGARIEWLPDYTILPLEKEPLFSQWRGWLKRGATIPDDKKDFARAVSTLVLFDYVTGNWDRWSGGNVATSNGKLYYVDNDGAFFATPPKDALARNKRYLEGVERYSRSVALRLRALTDEEITKRLSILSPKAIEGVLARRKEALAIVDKKELFFP